MSPRAAEPERKFARPSVYLYRAAAAHLRGFVTGVTPANAAKAMFGGEGDVVTDLILRAPSSPAAISGTSGWAAGLAGVAIYDMIQDAATYSAGAELIGRGLKINLDGIAEYRVPGRLLN